LGEEEAAENKNNTIFRVGKEKEEAENKNNQ
jgi:hypothetical protein